MGGESKGLMIFPFEGKEMGRREEGEKEEEKERKKKKWES